MSQIALIVAALALAFSTGWQVRDWKADSQELKVVVQKEAAQERWEVFMTQERIKYVKIIHNVDRVVKEPFYVSSDKCLDDAGLRLITEALTPASALPAASAPD